MNVDYNSIVSLQLVPTTRFKWYKRWEYLKKKINLSCSLNKCLKIVNKMKSYKFNLKKKNPIWINEMNGM